MKNYIFYIYIYIYITDHLLLNLFIFQISDTSYHQFFEFRLPALVHISQTPTSMRGLLVP